MSTLVKTQSTMPFKVRTGCGHIVIRRMREATAGVPFTSETIIEAPNGMPCEDCQREQDKALDLQRKAGGSHATPEAVCTPCTTTTPAESGGA